MVLYGREQENEWTRFYYGCKNGSFVLLKKIVDAMGRNRKPEQWDNGSLNDADILCKVANFCSAEAKGVRGYRSESDNSDILRKVGYDLLYGLQQRISPRQGDYDSGLVDRFIETLRTPAVVRVSGNADT